MQLSDLKPAWLIRREAITWLVRLRGDQSPETNARFQSWYRASLRNAAAYDLEEARFQRSYGLLRSSPLAQDRDIAPDVVMQPPRVRFALAAAVAALLLIPPVVLLEVGPDFLGQTPQALMLVSGVGEIRSFELADGSSVTLDAQSRVRLELSDERRTARIEQGRARLRIKAGKPAFRVTAGTIAVESVGGVLDISHRREEDRVEVRSGSAELAAGDSTSSRLAAGQAASMRASGKPRIFASADRADWTRGMLQFDNEPLANVIAAANRYSARRVLLGNSELGGLKVTGTFRAGDTQALVDALAGAFNLNVARGAEGSLILNSRNARPAEKKKGG